MQHLIILLILLILSGVFSGMEIAFFSLGAEKIKAFKTKKSIPKKTKQRIQLVEKLKKNTDTLLVTILIGNNIVNVAASSLATIVALDLGESFDFSIGTNTVVALVTGVMTLLILVFGEITPKSLAHKYALPFTIFTAPIIRFLQVILYPIIYPITFLTKQFTGDKETLHGLNEEELKAAIELSAQEGQIDEDEKELFERVLEFDEHNVESIMTPRSKIFGLADNLSTEEGIKAISEASFSRIPIYHDTLDNTIGILKVQSIISEFQKPDFYKKNLANLSLISPYKIPRTMKIHTLLKEFQATQNHLAFVYDEHGGLIGLITLEDVIEEVFGEFEDEADDSNTNIRQTGKQKFIMNAEIELEQIESFIKEKLAKQNFEFFPWEKPEENNTLSYFILEKLEHFPAEKESFECKTEKYIFTFVIEKSQAENIQEVSLVIRSKANKSKI